MIPENMAKLRSMVQRHEGLRLRPYQCSEGKWTVGWGHNLSAHSEPTPGIITLTQAEWYFEQDFAQAAANVEVMLHAKEIMLDDIRFSALVDMCFNIGIGGLRGFKKMLANLKLGDYARAATELLTSKYATQVGGRAGELAHMLSRGEWYI